ncbi:MAG TPA: ABC transporter permease [Geminicoccus sp.]|jgi:lipopolysaccharide transport system permease protein|uniref:ABC transporter permease n=1 Tax=Geminicoccus sp. TaxID=2024832 RepID=UPI002E31B312|nr:ABC transporter permease [Geminicoccus sp.]HEX2526393.1 ABC transporter permease [Geminicoccus sp.]
MQSFSASPRELVASLWRNRRLAMALVEREVAGRYRGSFMGIFWSLLQPMMMLAVYTFVFSVVFQARWGTGGTSKVGFALTLFTGLVVFNIFADCLNRAPGLIVGNTNFVKRVMFPIEILPWVIMGSSLFHAAVNVLVWMVFYILIIGTPHLSAFLLPVVLLPCIMFTMGLSWMLAALGVYLRDVAQIVGVVVTALMFLSPIFYPTSSLPESYQLLMLANPLTPSVEQARDVLMWGRQPSWTLFLAYLALGMLVAWLGFAWFQKTRKGFADVL